MRIILDSKSSCAEFPSSKAMINHSFLNTMHDFPTGKKTSDSIEHPSNLSKQCIVTQKTS